MRGYRQFRQMGPAAMTNVLAINLFYGGQMCPIASQGGVARVRTTIPKETEYTITDPPARRD